MKSLATCRGPQGGCCQLRSKLQVDIIVLYKGSKGVSTKVLSQLNGNSKSALEVGPIRANEALEVQMIEHDS
jgi:hypothetical protein